MCIHGSGAQQLPLELGPGTCQKGCAGGKAPCSPSATSAWLLRLCLPSLQWVGLFCIFEVEWVAWRFLYALFFW